jgi:2-methylisocitrate lyase-like PEP mutase family enzyme
VAELFAMASQKAKADAFRALHHGPKILVLPNAWDVASARIFEDAGFPAIATTSAGIAYSLGYADGQRIPPEEMLEQIARIVRGVNVPVTADVEGGYQDAGETAKALIASGAVGMNLEDATSDPAHPLVEISKQVETIQAVRAECANAGIPMVINARTDVYLAQVGAPESRYDETVRRLSAFKNAGADCLFVPGVRDAVTIRKLVGDLQFPINILAVPGAPSTGELQGMKVARVSVGSGPMRATMGLVRRLAEELSSKGTYSAFEGAIPYDEMNRLMSSSHDGVQKH